MLEQLSGTGSIYGAKEGVMFFGSRPFFKRKEKGLESKTSPLSRDADCPAEVLRHFVSIFSCEIHLNEREAGHAYVCFWPRYRIPSPQGNYQPLLIAWVSRGAVEMSRQPQRNPVTRHTPGSSQKLSKVMNLNVGGQIYTTTLGTLTRFPGSRLSEMFTGPTRLPVDSHGRLFIDRKGIFFKYILEFLRTQEPPSHFVEEIYQEALFYGIEPLVKVIQDLPQSYGEAVGRQSFLAQVANYGENIELIVRLARANAVSARRSAVVVCVVKSKVDDAEHLRAMDDLGPDMEPVVKFGPWDPSPTVSDMLFCIKMDIEKKGYKVSYQPYQIERRLLSKPCNFFYKLIFTWW